MKSPVMESVTQYFYFRREKFRFLWEVVFLELGGDSSEMKISGGVEKRRDMVSGVSFLKLVLC